MLENSIQNTRHNTEVAFLQQKYTSRKYVFKIDNKNINYSRVKTRDTQKL